MIHKIHLNVVISHNVQTGWRNQISISLFAKYVNISTATILVNSPDIDKRRFSINKHQQCGYKWVKYGIRVEPSGKFRKWYHFTVAQPFNPRKDNSYLFTITIQILRCYSLNKDVLSVYYSKFGWYFEKRWEIQTKCLHVFIFIFFVLTSHWFRRELRPTIFWDRKLLFPLFHSVAAINPQRDFKDWMMSASFIPHFGARQLQEAMDQCWQDAGTSDNKLKCQTDQGLLLHNRRK